MVPFGVPAAFFVTSILHLFVSENVQGFRDDAVLFLGIHLIQLPLVWLLAWVVFELLRDLDSQPARLARAAIVAFAQVRSHFAATRAWAFHICSTLWCPPESSAMMV